ncbi:ArsR/SmtB family transcription factor [Oerskovia sp. NPDC057915]|uniref:ArsR/SmtB family transcription factor n=1 Tax=Oerskovia sp. NPDC057915 TaxID=3346280 RepID=UPI0036DB339B
MPTNHDPEQAPEPRTQRAVGPDALKALSHPLRIQILDLLGHHSALTASGLAESLGESSGATSYHLRQLERHGFVQEVPGRGTARERWWERTPGGFTIELPDDEAATGDGMIAATSTVNREFEVIRQRKIMDFLDSARTLDRGWLEAGATLATINMWLTKEQLAEVQAEWQRFSETVLDRFAGQQDAPGARPVQIHFNAFPLINGKENPS